MGKSFLAPCRDPRRGCPKGTPEEPRTLTPENEMCYQHYLECRAVRQWPDDSVVRRNAAIIRDVEERVAKGKETESRDEMIELLISLRGK